MSRPPCGQGGQRTGRPGCSSSSRTKATQAVPAILDLQLSNWNGGVRVSTIAACRHCHRGAVRANRVSRSLAVDARGGPWQVQRLRFPLAKRLPRSPNRWSSGRNKRRGSRPLSRGQCRIRLQSTLTSGRLLRAKSAVGSSRRGLRALAISDGIEQQRAPRRAIERKDVVGPMHGHSSAELAGVRIPGALARAVGQRWRRRPVVTR